VASDESITNSSAMSHRPMNRVKNLVVCTIIHQFFS